MAVQLPGTAPDPRFSLANERTFLAWNRTALALIAGGLAAAQLLPSRLHGLRLLVALPLIALGASFAAASYLRWRRTERAMRLGQPLPDSLMPKVLAGGVATVATIGAILALIAQLAS